MRKIENAIFALVAFLILFSTIVTPLVHADAAPPTTSSISCAVSSTSVNLGNSITVTAIITPATSGVTVTLTYKEPNGSVLTRTAVPGINSGYYSDTYVPNGAGAWTVKASWPGDDTFFGATSLPVAFTVTSPQAKVTTGISMGYVYLAIVVVVIVVLAIATILYRKRK